jgi:cobyrinic acid a,c-diamide synthase
VTDDVVDAGGLPGLVLAGTASGVGKTVAALVVARALAGVGVRVVPGKTGPDYLDPSHHAAVLGVPSRTLDPWLSGVADCRRSYARGVDGAEPSTDTAARLLPGVGVGAGGDPAIPPVDAGAPVVRVVEGAMGLYDGDVSTARVASASVLDLPVVLVVDASAGMESVAATALGFRAYADRAAHEVDVAGVLATRAHPGRHAAGIREALPDELAWCGAIPPLDGLAIPDRHLGLHAGDETPVDPDALAEAADGVEARTLAGLARVPSWWPPAVSPAPDPDSDPPTVAVALDDAFRFVYPATVERLASRAGVATFSPVAGDPLPDCDGVYLPGGYPERHPAALSDADALATLADRAAEGLPVLAECGGLMVLGETLTVELGSGGKADDTDGADRRRGTAASNTGTYAMAGVLPVDVELTAELAALDHVELSARRDALTAPAGTTLRGHEFHYSEATPASDARFAFDVERGRGIDGDHDGVVEYRTLGTYAHVHPDSGAFDRFLDAVRRG